MIYESTEHSGFLHDTDNRTHICRISGSKHIESLIIQFIKRGYKICFIKQHRSMKHSGRK